MLEGTPTKKPRLLCRETQTAKTGTYGRRKEDAEKKTDTENKRTRAQKRENRKSTRTWYSHTVKQTRWLNSRIPKEAASRANAPTKRGGGEREEDEPTGERASEEGKGERLES